jgi:hypothetical protein
MAAALVLWAGLAASGQVVTNSTGTSANAFDIGLGTNKLTLTNSTGRLQLSNGLRITGGTIDFSGATVSNGGTFTTVDIDGGTIDGTTIGGTTRAAGSFTTLNSNNQYTNTLSTGTAPLVISSTTLVSNLNVEKWNGAGWTAGSTNGVAYQSGSAALTSTAAGTNGQLFLGQTGAAPAWVTMSGDATITAGGSFQLAASSVDSTVIASSAVDTNEIAANAVDTSKILNGTVALSDIAVAFSSKVAGISITQGSEVSDRIPVTIQLRDGADSGYSNKAIISWWLSDLVDSAGVTSQSPTIDYASGAQWHAFTANKKEIGLSNTSGTLIVGVTLTGDVTVYIQAECNGLVASATLDFN